MKSLLKLSALAVVFTLLTGCGAEPMPTKAEVSNAKAEKVKASMVKHGLQEVDYSYVLSKIGNGTRNGAKAVILDARPEKKYKTGHIPSARLLPDTKYEMFKSVVAKTPKNMEIITYCGGYNCDKSVKLATYLKKDGFSNVKIYWAGFPDWKKRNYYEVDNLLAMSDFKKDEALFIDARPAKKFKKSSIVGALNIPDTKFAMYKGRLPMDKAQKVITFCGGYKCEKSHVVAKEMRAMGYTNVYVLASGFPAWTKAGYPITGASTTAVAKKAPVKRVNKTGFLKFGVDEGSVDGEWFKELALSGKVPSSVALIDVRDPEEFKKGHFKGAINIHSSVKPKEFEKLLPQGKEVVLYCSTGARSMDVWSGFKDILKYPKERMNKILYFDANIECSGINKCKVEVNEPLGM